MQLVLLSGGSGQRLWPLSNSSRSKQFLPLIEREDGSRESMIQRVVRQAKEAGLGAEITIATNESQREIIINQLGEDVKIVTEPQRRDTFPAIALAACYLSLRKGCSPDEPVVVMPCDPCTELSYFKTIGRMVDCLGDADMVLMGITPTHPSTRFGYIVPETGSPLASGDAVFASQDDLRAQPVYPVARFTEKPDEKTAIELLYQHALWNGGVFAFKLGYLMDIVRGYTQETDFDAIVRKFAMFPKISFDYEVVEKARNVAVVPFSGRWKDLGTWSSLAGELSTNTVGRAIIGNNCSNVHAVNELQIPIYVQGINDAVVAASPDGILVCAKEDTDGIKDQVKALTDLPRYEERSWGTIRVVDVAACDDDTFAIINRVNICAGRNSSYHCHRSRTEIWTIVDGKGTLVLDGQVRTVRPGDTVTIAPGVFHAIKADTELKMLEVQQGFTVNPDDKERQAIEWIW